MLTNSFCRYQTNGRARDTVLRLCGCDTRTGHADPDTLIAFSYSYVLLALIYERVILHKTAKKWSFFGSIFGVSLTAVMEPPMFGVIEPQTGE